MENLEKQTDITAMQPAGRVLPLWRGEYRNGEFYEQTDIVLYNNSSYIAKQDTIGNPPPEPEDNANEYWQLIAKGILDADISASTVEFEEALTRENIESGETAETLFGKIKKIFADLKPIVFTESYSNLKDTPGIVSKNENGLVQKGDGQANKVWKTDNDGNPGWRDDENTQAITSVNGKTGAVTLTATDVNACPATGIIDKLTNICQITGIGFWAIGSIDNSYATAIGIDNNTGDFYALVLSYNGNGVDYFNFGTIILTTPRISGFHYEIQVWEGTASAAKVINSRSVLNTIEQISANTEGRNVAGALAAKAMMADYNAKINQVNSNLQDIETHDIKIQNENESYIVKNPEHAWYNIKNGVCYFQMFVKCNTPWGYNQGAWYDTGFVMPKPLNGKPIYIVGGNYSNFEDVIFVAIRSDTNFSMRLIGGVAEQNYMINGSYLIDSN